MHRILLIGATGRTGRQVLAQLPATGVEVRALVRNPDIAGLAPHVRMFRGDLTAPKTLDASLDGIDTVFLVWTAPPDTIAPAIQRIVKHARRIVFLSAPIKTQHPFVQQPNELRKVPEQIERLIEASPLEWTFLRPGMFSANCLWWWAPQIRAGADVIRWPYLDVPTAPIDERDIAAIAVRALCDDGHAGAEYVLTGPESLTQSDQISTIAQVIGRPLRIEEMSPQEARDELPGFEHLLDAWAAAAGHPAFMTTTFREITGTEPRTFREWAVDHAAQFRV